MPTPIQVAQRANISVQSVRNWSREYADLLSPGARGEAGPRLFTDEDVDTICAIAALRKSGLPPSEVMARIRQGGADAVIDVEPSPQTTPHEATEGHSQPTTALVALSSLHDAHNALQARVQAVERNQARLLGEALRWGMVLGAIGALVAGAFVLWVLWLVA